MAPSAIVRLAVLIDADNTSGKHAGALLTEVARYGVPTVKRAYGDWTTNQLASWKEELNRNAIQPVQQFSYTTGKNSTDSALIIDAMDLLYTGDLDAFAIVSSDSDFTRLATRLRESGKTVYGFGRRRTPESLVAACDRFVYLEVLTAEGESAPTPEDIETDADSGSDAAPLPDLRTILTAAINNTSAEDGWALLGSVGSYLNTRHASFDPRNYGFGKLVSLVRAQDYVEVIHEDGHSPRVRLAPTTKVTTRRRTTAKKAAAKKAQSS